MWQMVLITIIADKGFLTPHLMRPNPPYPLFCLPAPPLFFLILWEKGQNFCPKQVIPPPLPPPPQFLKRHPILPIPPFLWGKSEPPSWSNFEKSTPDPPHTHTHEHTYTHSHACTHAHTHPFQMISEETN